MATHADALRLHLVGGVVSMRQLIENMGVSRRTISRALTALGDEIVKIGAARSIHLAQVGYAGLDAVCGLR